MDSKTKTTVTADAAADKTNRFESLMRDETASMADRLEAFKALALERRATEARSRAPRWSILASDEERAEANRMAPEIFAALNEQERLRQRTQDFSSAPLVLFALGYKSDIADDGTVHYGPFAYIVRSVIRPRLRAIGDVAPIDYNRLQGSGGTFAERLYLLHREYQAAFGCLNELATPKLQKQA